MVVVELTQVLFLYSILSSYCGKHYLLSLFYYVVCRLDSSFGCFDSSINVRQTFSEGLVYRIWCSVADRGYIPSYCNARMYRHLILANQYSINLFQTKISKTRLPCRSTVVRQSFTQSVSRPNSLRRPLVRHGKSPPAIKRTKHLSGDLNQRSLF